MIINKRYKRDLKHNMSLYVSSTLLTILCLLLFYLYYVSGTGILEYRDAVFEKQHIEDAHFSTFMEIKDEDIDKYEEKYHLILEKQRYVNTETDGITARVFEKTEKVDIPYVTEGHYPEKDDEIVISEGYADRWGIKPGDRIKIRDRKYTVTGYAERPDYLYMLQNPDDTDKNITSFFTGYMTENAFRSLGNKTCQYLVIYNEGSDTEGFRKEINEKYIMSDYLQAENNFRITMMKDQPVLFIEMAYAVLFTLPLIAVILISIILSRKIRNEQKMIGTLSAFGYTKKQLIKHYAGFSAIPGIAGGVLTTVVIALIADSYGAMGLMDYEPLDIDFRVKVPQMVMGILVPTVMYVLSTIYTVNRLLKHDTTELLAGSVKGKEKHRKYLVGKKASIRTKFSVRAIIGNKGRTSALFLGVFLGGFVILWGLTAYDTISGIGNESAEAMGDCSYQYGMSVLREENPYGGEGVLATVAEDRKGNRTQLLGLEKNSLLKPEDEEGNLLETGKGYMITSLYAFLSGAEKGDTIEIINPLSMEKRKIKIDAIAENNYTAAIYTSKKNVSEITGISEDACNVLLSREPLDIPQEEISSLISREQIDDQYKSVKGQLSAIIDVFVIIGILICMVAVYISVNMIITENKTNISMLRVLGYDEKRIGKLLLRDNIYIVTAGIVLSIPAALMSAGSCFRGFTDQLGYLIETETEPLSYIISILLVLASYGVSLFFVKRKIGKTDMVESLKDNRE